MKDTPEGWPRISSSLYYADPMKAIAWLQEAFGFELRLLVESEPGKVAHSELTYGGGVIMVSEGTNNEAIKGSPPSRNNGANSQMLMVYVEDIDQHEAKAKAGGATITQEIALHDYGPEYWADRSYGAKDYEGHNWWFTQRVRNPPQK